MCQAKPTSRRRLGPHQELSDACDEAQLLQGHSMMSTVLSFLSDRVLDCTRAIGQGKRSDARGDLGKRRRIGHSPHPKKKGEFGPDLFAVTRKVLRLESSTRHVCEEENSLKHDWA